MDQHNSRDGDGRLMVSDVSFVGGIRRKGCNYQAPLARLCFYGEQLQLGPTVKWLFIFPIPEWKVGYDEILYVEECSVFPFGSPGVRIVTKNQEKCVFATSTPYHVLQEFAQRSIEIRRLDGKKFNRD